MCVKFCASTGWWSVLVLLLQHSAGLPWKEKKDQKANSLYENLTIIFYYYYLVSFYSAFFSVLFVFCFSLMLFINLFTPFGSHIIFYLKLAQTYSSTYFIWLFLYLLCFTLVFSFVWIFHSTYIIFILFSF